MRGGGKPPVGSFSNCARCEKQFTVTKYTMAANPGPGWLCHPCAKAGGIDPFKKPAVAPKPKRRRAEDKKSTTFEERRFPSLVSICVQIITRNIDNIEALGDIGTMNMQEISKAISKTRGLTPENVKLFYDAVQSKLTLYDATNLPSAAFSVMGALNPRLTTLRLDFCGQMDSAALDALSSHLPELKNIELLGPFLVRTESWQRFFQNHQLEEFLITQSPRFDLACLRALLASSGKSLRRLRLREVGKLNDKFINELCSLRDAPLQHLDLAHPSHSCSEDALIDLVKAVGSDLRYLDFSAHDELSDVFLTEGLAPHCHHVATLILQHLPLLTDAGVAGFFANYHCTPLTTLDLSRNPDLSSAALAALLAHSGSALERLSINGWKDTKHEALMEIGARAKELREVDVGWCREVDDFVVKAILEGGEDGVRPEHLQKVWVWGCGRVKGVFPRRPGVSVFGVEAHQVGGE
ncbi:RNI-like protein [Schizophyllum commune H4-8]|uniref:DNA repair protein rhp7 treble clef domain-containing protein n=1 Tax=Schizophyllum commune (strain H4-8 / FGSC 9210) TaxID=578458 RepID=D8Q1Y6_SCHCM|nr:RNI-like protein [Schizophyllum commune H4-8]KAI5895625.1 RNI-like protein [Schizophyllum commune H4-8]